MGSESIEPTRQKHHRSSSPDDADERSKRRKHRDSRQRRHHRRHRSEREKEEARTESQEGLEGGEVDHVEVEEIKLENNGSAGDSSVGEDVVLRVDYDMEEGEIVEDDGPVGYVNGGFEKVKRNVESDVESGEIHMNGYDNSNMGVTQENVERVDKNLKNIGKDSMEDNEIGEVDRVRVSRSEGHAEVTCENKHHKDNGVPVKEGKRRRGTDDEVERRYQKKSLCSEKRHNAVAHPYSNDKYMKGGPDSNLLESPESSKVGSRSQDTSVVGTASTMGDPFYIARERRSECDDERIVARDISYKHNSRYDEGDKEKECRSSRFTGRADRNYSRDTNDRYREESRDRDWDRTRKKEREEKEKSGENRGRSRTQDRYWEEREIVRNRARDRDTERDWERERERGRDKLREERNKGRDRSSEGIRDGGWGRHRYNDRDNDSDRSSKHQIYDNDEDVYRDKGNSSRHRRNSEDLYRERSRRNDLGNGKSIPNPEDRDNDEVLKREQDKEEDFQENIVMQLAEEEEDDLERIKEESRRRRQAILEKYEKQHADQQKGTQSQVTVEEQVGQPSKHAESAEVILENIHIRVEAVDTPDAESSFSVGKSPAQNGLSALEKRTGTGGLGDGTPKSEGSVDMFCDDMFAASPAGVQKTGKGDGLAIETSELHDNWDDAEGYYGYRIGEILDGRYEIVAAHGKGVFSTVVRAKDLKAKLGDPEEVAIKIIRNNETMYKAGMEELVILKKLVGADPDNRRHCVRFLSTFKYRNHLCLVFESLHMNLREILKKFGRNIGLKLTAVRAYAKQLLIALKHLKNCGVLHCDIKPDNILVNEAKNVLKLCDFGNAMFSGKNEITPYLVSRFYRAPEIILGLPYDNPMDMWSVGCCLFEIYTGKVLFPGPSNNDMLRLHMELKGPFPKKMLRKGGFVDHHFDQDLNFLATEEDRVTRKTLRRLLVNIKPKDFGTIILGSPGEDPKMLANFKDLMEKIFVLDPDKRLNVSQALSHPFITGNPLVLCGNQFR